MGAAFLSGDWFELAAALACGRVRPRPGEGPDRTVVFDGGDGVRWHLVLEGGALTRLAPGDAPDAADLALRWPREEAAAWYRGERSGTEALAGVMLADGSPPSPLDVGATAELAALPRVVGASLVIQYRFGAGPFGPVDYWWEFEDGRSRRMGLGAAPEPPDVTVSITFQRMVGVRTGAITVLEALEDGGRVDGQVGPLMLLAGLQESPELHAAELAAGPSGPVLADLGTALAVPEQASGMAELARQTT